MLRQTIKGPVRLLRINRDAHDHRRRRIIDRANVA
jgi:hypothetical protein